MSQNSMRVTWTREEMDQRLLSIMRASTSSAVTPPRTTAQPGNYVHGANIAGFVKVADAMLSQGLI